MQSISRNHISRNYNPVIYKCTINTLHIVAHTSRYITKLKSILRNSKLRVNRIRRRRGDFSLGRDGDVRRLLHVFATMSTGKGLSFRTRWRVHDPSLLSCAQNAP